VRSRCSDQAGNTAISSPGTLHYDAPGCSVGFQRPGEINEDADPDLPGVQTELVVMFGEECIGQTAFADCGHLPVARAVIPDSRLAVFPVTVCATEFCTGSYGCTASVTSPVGEPTFGGVTLDVAVLPRPL
jgi:hypothetical protein